MKHLLVMSPMSSYTGHKPQIYRKITVFFCLIDKPMVLINHHVFSVKFAFACKCFTTFLGTIVNYVVRAATETCRIINRLVFKAFHMHRYYLCQQKNSFAKVCMWLTFHLMQDIQITSAVVLVVFLMSKKWLTIFPDLTSKICAVVGFIFSSPVSLEPLMQIENGFNASAKSF